MTRSRPSSTFNVAKGPRPRRRWILDADLTAAFDRIEHHHLLASLGTFPARELIERWLKAGVVEAGRLAPTEEGTPQGGVISPLLMNVALHGMERAAGVRYRTSGIGAGHVREGSPVLIRYADDLVALCHSQEQAEQVKADLAAWLAPRGLTFNEDKTRIVHLDDGFDFLGFNVRFYRRKLLIKPSAAAPRRIRERMATEVRALRGFNAAMVVITLNPIIRGWAAYYRIAVSSEAFSKLDDYMWKLMYKWSARSHRYKPRHWVTARYFGRFNSSRQDKWVFGDRESGAYLHKVLLDEDRTPRTRQGLGITRGSNPDRVLGRSATQEPTPTQRHHAAAASTAARPVPAVRNAPAARRTGATRPARVGAVAACGPQGADETIHHRRPGPGPHRRSTCRSAPATRPLRARGQYVHASEHGYCTSPRALGACLSRVRLTPHARF